MRIPVLVSIFLYLTALPALAAPVTTPAPAATPAAQTEKKSTPTAPEDRLDAKAEEMMKGLDENQTRQFAAIRTAHGTIRAVEDVKGSLDRAVKSCSKANPDIGTEMDTRFQAWKNEVLPLVRQGQNRLEKMILTQSFTRPSNVRGYLKAFDDLVKARKDAYTEVPVSTKEACQSLNKNMDKSQRVMGRLIVETLGLDKEIKTKE